jgi:CHAT domain-containing protein
LALLNGDLPSALASSEIAEQRKFFEGMAHLTAQDFPAAHQAFAEAERMAVSLPPSLRCQLWIARGSLAIDERNYPEAEENYTRALALARQSKLLLQELNVITDLGRLEPSRGRFDKAIDTNNKALELAHSLASQGYTATILGNMAWSYSELGDFEVALDYFKQGAKVSESSGLPVLAAYWLTGIANAEIALHDYAGAEDLAEKTLKQARQYKNAQTITECLNILANIALRTGRLDQAEKHNQEALSIERSGGDTFGLPDSLMLAGEIATARGHLLEAEKFFREAMDDPKSDKPTLWQATSGLAGARDLGNKTEEAEQLYQQAIGIIEDARSSVEHEELRLSFLSSGIAVYGEYIDFLVRHGRTADALRQADLSRARTLAEGLSPKTIAKSQSTWPVQPQKLAQRLHATLLFYWLGERRSYVWAITPEKTEYFTLPPAQEIEPLIKEYAGLTLKSSDLAVTASEKGQKLFSTLVAPAGHLIPPGSRVVLLSDGVLNTFNPETLIVPEPKPHFWIEDAILTTANSLSMLQDAVNRPHTAQKSLLIIGDTVPVPGFPTLPQAQDEMKKIKRRYPGPRSTTLQAAAATAKAYSSSRPDRYSYIHFVTHGTASSARPLESAVVLSKEPDSDVYKLYARDILTHPLKAELVTISACNGSGKRTFAGEGLVGLSWAFLRAGAHNVIGALWEVSDVSTPQLMDKMYAELARGKDPATALRNAKLSLLHQHNVYAKPFYWAPFQLYSGS